MSHRPHFYASKSGAWCVCSCTWASGILATAEASQVAFEGHLEMVGFPRGN